MSLMRIIGLEGQSNDLTLQVQFNPKEIDLDRTVMWQQQPNHGPADLEYVSSGPTTVAFELMFDGYESGTSVQPSISKLQQLADIDAVLHRPPKVRIVWGGTQQAGGFPSFVGVIESLSVRYLQFLPDGVVVKATVALKFKGADKLKVGHP